MHMKCTACLYNTGSRVSEGDSMIMSISMSISMSMNIK